MTTLTVTLATKCAECGKGGSTDNGLCLRCNTKAMRTQPMKSVIGREVQARWRLIFLKGHGR